MKYVENLLVVISYLNTMRFKKTTNIDIINIYKSKEW